VSTLAVCVGDNCIDHYVEPVEAVFSGGNAVNVAVYLQRSGIPTAYVGAIGSDPDGEQLLSDLARQEVDVSHVHVFPGKTAFTRVRLGKGGDREFLHEDIGVQLGFTPSGEDFDFICQHRLVHNTWMGQTEDLLPRFKQQAGLLVSFDYGERYSLEFVERTIPFVDVAFFSSPEDAAQDAEGLAREMRRRGPGLVAVTCGSLGSVLFDGKTVFQPAYPVEVVDTLGAGDTYIGTFLGHWLQGRGIPECMHLAAQAASRTCTQYGAWR
jgi:fructoselysine 6-kinase